MALGAMEKIKTWVCTMPIDNMLCHAKFQKEKTLTDKNELLNMK